MIPYNGLRTMYRPYCFIGLWIMSSQMINFCSARGPHHPRGEINKIRADQQKHINEHLAHDPKHIEDDLKEHQIPIERKVEEMSDEERNYLYFKIHDHDDNGKLDGLEILYSATHHSNGHVHDIHTESDDIEPSDSQQQLELTGNNSDVDQNLPNLNLFKSNENDHPVDESFNHVVDVLDRFFKLADLNDDGYLNYAEYAAAVKMGQTTLDTNQRADL